ncbi:MAG: PKD domain-containing protein [Reichenbachiella sp.]
MKRLIDLHIIRKRSVGHLWFAVIALLLLFNSPLRAQDHNLSESHWIFGDSDYRMTFDKSDAVSQLDSGQFTPYGTGGGAVISNPVTGDLIFYTDGQRIYDANNIELPGAGLLTGEPSLNNSAVVWPMPYSTGTYYVFTNSGNGGVNEIQYAMLDRNLAGNATAGEPSMGDATAINQTTGLVNPSDAMLMVKQDNDNYWLITQDNTTNEYRVTALNSTTGIGATVNYLVNDASFPEFEAASLAYDEPNGRIAAAPKDENRNVYIFDFDEVTGILGFRRSILNTGFADGQGESIYDLEWSASGSQLYISRYGDNSESGNVYQYDFNDLDSTVNAILFQPVFRSYGLERGPDNLIYHLYQQSSANPIEIGVVIEADSTFHTDSLLFNIGYDSLAFAPSNINGFQFPSFAAPHFEEFDSVGFAYLDTCALLTTKFFSYVEPTPQSYLWDFGDGTTFDGVAPVHTFGAAGSYAVSLTVTLNDVEEVYTQNINIVENDLMIDLGTDTVRCPGEVFTYDAGEGGVTYAWNTGDTTQTISVDTTGVFSVAVVSAATGCMNYAYVQVTTYEDLSQFRNQWYFGEMAGIDFNDPAGTTGTVAIVDNNLMTSPQAASSVSDLNGELLFYTNGISVWNQEHELMMNGDHIGGDSTSMQGAMIVPLPGDSSIFYIFTTDPVYNDFTYNMRYSIVDMRQDLMRGAVVAKNIPFFTNSSERMASFGLGQSVTQLVTHEYGNNIFRTYQLGVDGIGAPTSDAVGSVLRLNEEKMATAELQIADNGQVIAMAIQDGTENFVELFGLDTLGNIVQLTKIDIEEPTPSLVYGLEFSSGASKLYVTTNGNGSKLLQYDLDSLYTPTAEVEITASKFELSNSSAEYGVLQTGSDGVIYLAIDNSSTIGTISSPDGDDDQAGFVEDGFDLEGRTSRLGLPNFVQTIPLNAMDPGIAFDNACLGQETTFEGTGTSVIDNYLWTFGDGTSAAVEDTTHLYNLSGPYDVSLNVTNRCGLDTLFLETVTVNAIPVTPTLQDAAAICNGPVVLAAWPTDTAAFFYTWSTGETTREITVSENALIDVFITDSTGCQSDPGQSFVDDTSPLVSLGADQFVCQNEVFADLDARNPGSNFTWTLNGIDLGNTLSVQPVASDVVGVFTYEVEVVDMFGCITLDDITLSVQPMPDFSFATVATSGCGATDGELNIDIVDAGTFTYELTGGVNVGPNSLNGPAVGEPVSNALSGGAYTIAVTNTVTGCSNPQTATVVDGGTFNSTFNATPGCPGDGSLEVSMQPAGTEAVPTTVNYELYDEIGNVIIPSTLVTVVGDGFNIDGLDSGTYALVIQGNFAGYTCTSTIDGMVLTGLDLADFTVQEQFICGDEGRVGLLPITMGATDPILYSWSGVDIIGSAQGDSIIVGSAGVYQVTSSATGFCAFTQEVTVFQNPLPEIAISVDGVECDGALVLTADVTSTLIGDATFSWNTGLNGQNLPVIASGGYEVTVLDRGSGCINTAERSVVVFDELTVFIVADPNCDDNAEVFLSAYANITEDVAFEWTNINGEVLPTTSAEVSIGESGNYSVRVSSLLSSCEATSSMDAAVVPITDEELLLPQSESFCSLDTDPANGEVALDPGSFVSYDWTIVNDAESLSTDRIYITNEAGIYEVTLTNGFTCIRDLVEVYDNCEPMVEVPNAFAPNGVNNQFFVYPNDYVSNFEIKIYARWGELLYYSTDMGFRWDGVFKGAPLQEGTYAYIMRYKSLLNPDRGEIIQRGGVLLLR